MEIRSYSEKAAPVIDSGRLIRGYAVVFGQESRVMYEDGKFFIEVIERGAISEDLLNQSDIKALIEHNNQRLLARSINGEGSLILTLDEFGLKYRFDSPSTPDGEYAYVMVDRRDLRGSSFAYITDEKKNVTYKKQGNIWLRTVHKIDKLFDVSIVADPAYIGTKVTTRSISDLEAALTPPTTEFLEKINDLRKLI